MCLDFILEDLNQFSINMNYLERSYIFPDRFPVHPYCVTWIKNNIIVVARLMRAFCTRSSAVIVNISFRASFSAFIRSHWSVCDVFTARTPVRQLNANKDGSSPSGSSVSLIALMAILRAMFLFGPGGLWITYLKMLRSGSWYVSPEPKAFLCSIPYS